MNFKKLLYVFFILMFSVQVNAFNWNKCEQRMHREWPGADLLSSTSSYLSSTGDCAMIGQIEYDKKVFIAENLDTLKIESAQGSGEYISTYAMLSGCDQKSAKAFAPFVKKHFYEIYGRDLSNPPEKIYEQMESLLSSDAMLGKSCSSRSFTRRKSQLKTS